MAVTVRIDDAGAARRTARSAAVTPVSVVTGAGSPARNVACRPATDSTCALRSPDRVTGRWAGAPGRSRISGTTATAPANPATRVSLAIAAGFGARPGGQPTYSIIGTR